MRAIASSKAGDVQSAMAVEGAPGEANAAAPKGEAGADQNFANYLDAKQPGNGSQDVNAGKAAPKADDQNAKTPVAPDAPEVAVATIAAAPRKVSAAEKKGNTKEDVVASVAAMQQAAVISPLMMQMPVQVAPRVPSTGNTTDEGGTGGKALAKTTNGSVAFVAKGAFGPVAATAQEGAGMQGSATVQVNPVQARAAMQVNAGQAGATPQVSVATPADVVGETNAAAPMNAVAQTNAATPAKLAVQTNVVTEANFTAQIAAGASASPEAASTATLATNTMEPAELSSLAAATQQIAPVGQAASTPQAATAGQTSPLPAGRIKGVPAWAAARAVAGGAAEIADGDANAGTKSSGGGAALGGGKGGAVDNEELVSNGTSSALQGQPMAVQAPVQQSKTPFQVGGSIRFTTDAASVGSPTTAATTTAKAVPVQISARTVTGAQATTPATATAGYQFSGTATAPADKTFTTSAAGDVSRQQELTTTTLNRVMDAAATMRTSGENRVELQVKLDDGQQITVRLQMTQGTVHPIFKTESPELRQALEQGWAGFRSSASEKGLEIAAPVFESPGSESGFGSFGSREQSGQAGGENFEAEETLAGQPGQGTAKQTSTVATVPTTTGSAVQLYA